MKRFVFGLFAIAIAILSVGCHHSRCHSGGCWEETKVKYKYKYERRSYLAPSCLPAAPVVPLCQPVVPIVPSVPCPQPLVACPGPVSVMVQEEVCQPVTVCVPVYRWVWNPCQCRYVYVQVGMRSECRMVRRLVSRPVTAYWSASRGCYGWTDCHGNWRPHHYRR